MKLFDSNGLTPFNPESVAFGRHETFGLRYGWMTKGFQALVENPQVFESDDATVTLGVGKNMVNAIRYWLQAARIVEKTKSGLEPTQLGKKIFLEDGWDPYLEDEGTIWLIHWLIATNAELATAWYWFFNRFHKPSFTTQELSNALSSFAKEQIKAKTAETTLKGDAALVLRMYVQSNGTTRTPLEDALDSPLSLLRLVTRSSESKSYISKPDSRDELPIGIFGCALIELFDKRNTDMLPIETLMYSTDRYPALGSVFRLTEDTLIKKLENFISYIPGKFELRDTAGIHQLYRISKIDPLRYLKKHYEQKARKAAA